ncbi:MAG: hypothetical protein ACRD0X_04450 [Thermoanaerobaculia bacterium]
MRRSPRRVLCPAPAVLLAACLLGACSEQETPVASVTVQPTAAELPYPGLVTLEFGVQMTQPLGVGGRPLVFVHLLDGHGNVVRTFDHEFPQEWRPGGEVRYEVVLQQSALAPPLAGGEYALTLGLYRDERRWPLSTTGSETDAREYQLAAITVPEDGSPAPMFNFSPSWLPTEGGTDNQILGRRWLSSAGVLRLAEIPGPGTVRLALRLPEPRAGQDDVVYAEGYSSPGLRITSSCGGQEFSISGFGAHVVEVPIQAGSDGATPGSCELRFQPFSQLVEKRSLQARAALLEGLAWRG